MTGFSIGGDRDPALGLDITGNLAQRARERFRPAIEQRPAIDEITTLRSYRNHNSVTRHLG